MKKIIWQNASSLGTRNFEMSLSMSCASPRKLSAQCLGERVTSRSGELLQQKNRAISEHRPAAIGSGLAYQKATSSSTCDLKDECAFLKRYTMLPLNLSTSHPDSVF